MVREGHGAIGLKDAWTEEDVRGCLKSPDSRQILSSMCLLQLPDSWDEACTTSVNLALAGLFKHPLRCIDRARGAARKRGP